MSPARHEWCNSLGMEGALSVGAQDVSGGSESEYRTVWSLSLWYLLGPQGQRELELGGRIQLWHFL